MRETLLEEDELRLSLHVVLCLHRVPGLSGEEQKLPTLRLKRSHRQLSRGEAATQE